MVACVADVVPPQDTDIPGEAWMELTITEADPHEIAETCEEVFIDVPLSGDKFTRDVQWRPQDPLPEPLANPPPPDALP
jgi:hypothetical protein